MYIPNYDIQNYPFPIHYNYWLRRLYTQFNKPSNQNPISKRIRKRYLKTLGTRVINSPMSSPSLPFFCVYVGLKEIYIHMKGKSKRMFLFGLPYIMAKKKKSVNIALIEPETALFKIDF